MIYHINEARHTFKAKWKCIKEVIDQWYHHLQVFGWGGCGPLSGTNLRIKTHIYPPEETSENPLEPQTDPKRADWMMARGLEGTATFIVEGFIEDSTEKSKAIIRASETGEKPIFYTGTNIVKSWEELKWSGEKESIWQSRMILPKIPSYSSPAFAHFWGYSRLLEVIAFYFYENPPSLPSLDEGFPAEFSWSVDLPLKEEGSPYHLFHYPDPDTLPQIPLAQLLDIREVFDKETEGGIITATGRKKRSKSHRHYLIFSFCYHDLDFFGPFALAIPTGEGIYSVVIDKKLKDVKKQEFYGAGNPAIDPSAHDWDGVLTEILSIPIWDYTIRWYLGIKKVREVPFPKESQTSHIVLASPPLEYPWILTQPSEPLPYVETHHGLLISEIDLPYKPSPNLSFFLPSGRKILAPFNPQNLRNIYCLPKGDKHKRLQQSYPALPPIPTVARGHPAMPLIPFEAFAWHWSGNPVVIRGNGWKKFIEENPQRFPRQFYPEGLPTPWQSFEYNGLPITPSAINCSIPPPDVLEMHLGEPVKDAIFLSFLLRPEMPEAILFWFEPEDEKFWGLYYDFATLYFYALFYGGASLIDFQHLPFWLAPQDPRPIIWGNLKMLVWRKGTGVVAERDLGRYPIQYLFPAIEKQTGAIYLPLLADMQGDGSGIFQLLVFRRNDWSPDIYDLGGE
jgi:hypothetical protein